MAAPHLPHPPHVSGPEDAQGRVPLAWWLRLRLAGAGAGLAATAAAIRLLDLPLPVGAIGALLGTVVVTSAVLALRLRGGSTIPLALLGGVLALDTAILTAVLALSGGPSNPFSVLYLVNVALAVVVLPPGGAWAMTALSVLSFGLLFLDGDAHAHHGDGGFSAHLQGMWLAFTLAAALITALVGRVQRELRDREAELARLSSLAARSERLASLTTLSAGAAHELGTPLATIAVVAGDLEQGALAGDLEQGALAADARLIRQEIDRCRQILEHMSERAGETIAEPPEALTLKALGEIVRARLSAGLAARVVVELADPAAAVTVPPRALAQVVGGLLKNGADASPPGAPVRLALAADGPTLTVRVIDEGAGMDAAVAARAGEPFFTTKGPGEGMGLGLYLARLFAERLGGTLELRSAPGRGTTVTLVLPRSADGADVPGRSA